MIPYLFVLTSFHSFPIVHSPENAFYLSALSYASLLFIALYLWYKCTSYVGQLYLLCGMGAIVYYRIDTGTLLVPFMAHTEPTKYVVSSKRYMVEVD